MQTLATLNETLAQQASDWSNGLTIKTRWAVGRTGRSRRGATGGQLHLLRIEEVVADKAPAPNRVKVGQAFFITSPCNANGQRTGAEVAGKGVEAVTCKKCLKRAELMGLVAQQ